MNTCHSQFSLTRARDLARSAALAYASVHDAAHIAVVDDPLVDTRVMVARFPDRVEIAFRGTRDLRNWLLDLNIYQRSLGQGVRVHAGFLRGVDGLLPGLIAQLLPPGANKADLPPLHFTGHSLGGALATLAAWALAREGFPVASVYSFASPRVGNGAWRRAFAEALGAVTFRVRCTGDLVPLVPGVLDGYRHVGREVLLDDGIHLDPTRRLELLHDLWRCARAWQRGEIHAITRFHSLEHDYFPQLGIPYPIVH